jgi:hypothetical protein
VPVISPFLPFAIKARITRFVVMVALIAGRAVVKEEARRQRHGVWLCFFSCSDES